MPAYAIFYQIIDIASIFQIDKRVIENVFSVILTDFFDRI